MKDNIISIRLLSILFFFPIYIISLQVIGKINQEDPMKQCMIQSQLDHDNSQHILANDLKEKNPFALHLPDGFVYLSNVDPTIIQSLRYYTQENFVGSRVDGYLANKVIMTKQAAQALSRVQKKLNKDGYKIVVYDSYRPQKAVDHFVRWAEDPNALSQKAKYYPYKDKSVLFDEGYIAKKSGHTRGSTVDISIIKIKENLKPMSFKLRTLNNGQIIMLLDDGTQDFGSRLDLFSQASHPQNNLVDQNFIQKRKYLINMMKSQGFNVINTQWWHFTLQNEPFPNTYFDFDIV